MNSWPQSLQVRVLSWKLTKGPPQSSRPTSCHRASPGALEVYALPVLRGALCGLGPTAEGCCDGAETTWGAAKRRERGPTRARPHKSRPAGACGRSEAQVRLPHRGKLPDRARRALDRHLATLEHVGVVAHCEGHLHVLLDEQHRQAV